MKKENEIPELSPEEKIKAENELLKMKLTAEFGMQSGNFSLDHETENEWLNYLYQFEKSYSKAKRIKVYDFIGRPDFRKISEMNDNEVEVELNRLIDIMHESNISLDCLSDYEDEVIYNFITEELFDEETDDIRIDGMMHCFIYEEFHPNHDYDLRCLGKEFYEYFFSDEWNEIVADHQLDENMIYNKKDFTREDFVKIMLEFREHKMPFRLFSNDITEVKFDLLSKEGSIEGAVKYQSNSDRDISEDHSGNYVLRCKFNDFYWTIYEINFPGFEKEV